MPEKINVYFNNNFHAVFTTDRIRLVAGQEANLMQIIDYVREEGLVIINWDNVCFIRPYEEHEEED